MPSRLRPRPPLAPQRQVRQRATLAAQAGSLCSSTAGVVCYPQNESILTCLHCIAGRTLCAFHIIAWRPSASAPRRPPPEWAALGVPAPFASAVCGLASALRPRFALRRAASSRTRLFAVWTAASLFCPPCAEIATRVNAASCVSAAPLHGALLNEALLP